MKKIPQLVRITFWITLGLAISIVSLGVSKPLPVAQEIEATPTKIANNIVAKAGASGDIGSTDGLMLVTVMIVLIIIIPILVRRGAWSNGGRKGRLQRDQTEA